MAIIRWDPFLELNNLHSQINSMFNDTFGGTQASTPVVPTTDVYSNDQGLVVEAHLPNFDKDEINIQQNEGDLEIKAEHREKEESKDKIRKYLVRESVNSYYRRFTLPKNSDIEHVDADYENGVLKVVIPFKELPKPKKIAIKSRTNSKKALKS